MIGSSRPTPRRPRAAMRAATIALAVLTSATAGCHDLLNPPLPAGTQDPKTFNTEAGALGRYHTAIETARDGFVKYMVESAELTDEVQEDALHRPLGLLNAVDERILTEGVQTQNAIRQSGISYTFLHTVRGDATEAIGALAKYAPAQPAALRGELYALRGFAEIGLADLFCSGVPLSTLDFEGDYTYHAGSTTSEVYQHAIALFDTARTLGADSARIVNFAAVAKARALLALGQYADAAQAAADVPDDFRYELSVDWRGQQAGPEGGAASDPPLLGLTVADQEGLNGLDFVSSGDPRTPTHPVDLEGSSEQAHVPDAYTDVAPLTLASGVEARLIEAEAALNAGGDWLAILNALRTDGTFDTQPDPTDATKTDTLWHGGTGGVAGLRPLDDPGTQDARVDLLFRERAFWLFLTGHRQGDLRRLLRQYHRPQNEVYPIGSYAGGFGTYGSDVTVPIPVQELANPLFTGCFNRNP
jgi:hypothetical protein